MTLTWHFQAFVKQNGLSISFTEGDLRKNKEIIIEAIKQNRESYDFIDNSMKLDKDVSAAFMQYSMIQLLSIICFKVNIFFLLLQLQY